MASPQVPVLAPDMTSEQQARTFLARFPGFTPADVAELAAMLDVAREAGAEDAEWSRAEPTRPGTRSTLRPLIEATARS